MTDLKSLLIRAAIRSGYYPSLGFSRAMWLLGRWHWWDRVDDGLYVGALPSRGDLRRLSAIGIGAVVNMCEEFQGHARELAALRMTQCRIPTLDYHCPSVGDLERGLAFIAECRADGVGVYVHCKAGRGRSPTLALCYLMAAHGLDAREAYARVKAARPHVNNRLYELPNVRAMESRILAGDGSHAAAAPRSGSKNPAIKLT